MMCCGAELLLCYMLRSHRAKNMEPETLILTLNLETSSSSHTDAGRRSAPAPPSTRCWPRAAHIKPSKRRA